MYDINFGGLIWFGVIAGAIGGIVAWKLLGFILQHLSWV